jgi:hypothetical protein
LSPVSAQESLEKTQVDGLRATFPVCESNIPPEICTLTVPIFMPHQRKGGIHESTEYSWETFGWYRLTGLLSFKYLERHWRRKIPLIAGFLFLH